MSFTAPAYSNAKHFFGFLAGVAIGKISEIDEYSLQNTLNKSISQKERQLIGVEQANKFKVHVTTLNSMHHLLKSKFFAVKSFRDVGMEQEAKEVASEIRPLMKEIQKMEVELKKMQTVIQLQQRQQKCAYHFEF